MSEAERNMVDAAQTVPDASSAVAPSDRPWQVLVLCTGNSARSILGEALLNHYGAPSMRAWSAGSRPTGRVHPLALQVLEELGIDAGRPASQSWEAFAAPDAPRLDIAITVCDSAAREPCPLFAGAPMRLHWGLPDPARVSASAAPEEALRAFRRTACALAARSGGLLALLDGHPPGAALPETTRRQLQRLGALPL